MNNLNSLGIIERREEYYITLENEFINIEKQYQDIINSIFNKYTDENELQKSKKKSKAMYELTSYGKLFISSCLSET